jgi:hypothetical protein
VFEETVPVLLNMLVVRGSDPLPVEVPAGPAEDWLTVDASSKNVCLLFGSCECSEPCEGADEGVVPIVDGTPLNMDRPSEDAWLDVAIPLPFSEAVGPWYDDTSEVGRDELES